MYIEENTVKVLKYVRIDGLSPTAVEAVNHQTGFFVPLVLNILPICNEGAQAVFGGEEIGYIQVSAQKGLRGLKGFCKACSMSHQCQALVAQVHPRECIHRLVDATKHTISPSRHPRPQQRAEQALVPPSNLEYTKAEARRVMMSYHLDFSQLDLDFLKR
ncbi:hypothetical protein SDC9_123693 [bioreactor metagenome]|uniref:Uncharacterized protein n=1 Tax=bioreactor metagenome TaxID=1076179 RepID=A0A645CIF5_9ZZZZ